jgi:hypothetical protein
MDHRLFVFTVHKAASLGVYDVMRRVAKKEGWRLYSANLKAANLVEPEAPGDPTFYEQVADKSGLVGPVRMPVALPERGTEKDRYILHLRDPRDVLVSMFYSWSYSHPGVNDAYREQLRERGVNDFALRESAALHEKYAHYVRDFLPLPQTTLLKYEDFVTDRPKWLSAFLGAAGLDPDEGFYKRLARRNPAAKLRKEDVHAHIRKAEPGDYLDKLDAETIATLNRQWEGLLNALDY